MAVVEGGAVKTTSVQVTPNTYVLRGGSNIGFVVHERKVVVIDAGLDKDAARRTATALGERGAEAAAIVTTHAYANPFGGAEALKKGTQAPVYVTPFEAAVVENPLLEPLWLFGGAWPILSLVGKFTPARPCWAGLMFASKAMNSTLAG